MAQLLLCAAFALGISVLAIIGIAIYTIFIENSNRKNSNKDT